MDDEENKRALPGIRPNALDVAVLFLVFFVFLAAWQKNNMIKAFEEERTRSVYAVAFEITSVRYDLVRDLETGTALYSSAGAGAQMLGTMLDEPVIMAQGGILAGDDTLVDLMGIFFSNGVLRNESLVLSSDLVIVVGEELLATTEIANMRIRVISITEIR